MFYSSAVLLSLHVVMMLLHSNCGPAFIGARDKKIMIGRGVGGWGGGGGGVGELKYCTV